MKHGKRPSLKEKKLIATLKIKSRHLNPENWLVVKDTPAELHIIHKDKITGVRIWNKNEQCWKN